MKILSSLRVFLVGVSFLALERAALAVPLFQQDFPNTTLAYFMSATAPSRGQFNDISAEPLGGTWSIVDIDNDVNKTNYALQLVRAASTDGAGFCRRTNLSATAPGIVCLRFDLSVNNTYPSEKAGALIVEFGNMANTSADYNTAMPAADLFGRMYVDLKGDKTFKLKLDNKDATSGYNYADDSTKCWADGTVATVSYYLNNSGTTQWFRDPNGAANYLSNGKCQVWIEWDDNLVSPMVHRVYQAVGPCLPPTGANGNLNNFRFRWTTADTAAWCIDNVRVENLQIPSMYAFPAERLVEARARIAAQDPAIMPAYQELISEAQAIDSTTEFPPPNVTQTNTAAYFSSTTVIDPRDYVSIGIYWWPPDSTHSTWWWWDGHPNHANEVNTDMGNFDKVCDGVTTLCWAYYLTPATPANAAQRTAYVQQVSALMNAWFLSGTTGMNPNLQHAAVIPFDSASGEGGPAGLMDGTRIIEVCDSIALIADSQTWSGASQQAWMKWIRDYRTWLLTPGGRGDALMSNPLNGPYNNNHTTWFDAQVAEYSLMVGDYGRARQKITDAHLQLRLPYQSTASGSEPNELTRQASLDYSAFCAHAMISLAQQGQYFNYNWTLQTTSPPSPFSGRSLRKVIDFIAPYVSASPAAATATADWRTADPDAPQNQGDRLETRQMLSLGASIWYGTSTYSTYWSNIAPLLVPNAGYTTTSGGVTTNHLYSTERWNLYLPPAPSP